MQNVFRSIQDFKRALPNDKDFTLVGGAFDLLHVGHLNLLEFAHSLGGLLVVCVLSDTSIRCYKGENRPILDEDQRLRMVASIRYVDFVYLSDESPSSVYALTLLQPHRVVFGGGEENAANVTRWMERVLMHSPSTQVHLLPRHMDDSVSTSHIITRIRELPI